MHYANDEHRMHLTCEQYTAHATASGQGRNGKVVSDDDCGIELRLAMPRSLGGKGDGQNPEQLFAMGYAGAYMRSFLSVRACNDGTHHSLLPQRIAACRRADG